MWTDRTGAFKVEAQFLSCANGKIRLFKTNGVKIDVPTEKMCQEDLKYIENETGQKLIMEDDNIPLGQLNRFSWLEYFKKANLPRDACLKYTQAFEKAGISERDIDRLPHHRMKSLGLSERHVRRIQRFIETERAEPPSEDEGEKKNKVKKSVTFGAVSYIEVENDEDEDDNGENNVQWQIEQDERLARQLQEQEQGPGLQRRGTGRPTPAQSAPRGVNSSVLTPHKFSSEPLKPTPAAPSPVKNNVPIPPPKFEDDAWAPRSISQNTPPQIPPRQQQQPQTQQPQQQQSLVDPQLLSKWGGSPGLAAANSRPVPPPPTANSPNHQALNSLLTTNNNQSMYYQPNNSFTTTQPPPQLSTSGSFTPQQQQLSTGGSFTPGQQHLNTGGSFTAGHSPALQHQPLSTSGSFTHQLNTSGNFTPGQTPQQQQQSLPTGGSFNFGQQQQSLPTGGSFNMGQTPQQQSLPTGGSFHLGQTQQPTGGSFNSIQNLPSTGSFPSLASNNFVQQQYQQPVRSASFGTQSNFQQPPPPQQGITNAGSFSSSSIQPNQYQQGYGYSPSLQNTSFMGSTTSLQSQMTGASWASATPANPFGGGSGPAPVTSQQQQQPTQYSAPIGNIHTTYLINKNELKNLFFYNRS